MKCLLVATFLVFQTGAFNINCKFRNVDFEIVTLGTEYTCLAAVIPTGYANIQRITGNHEPEKVDDDVKALQIHFQNMAFIPAGIAEYLKYLTVIEIFNSKLQSISAGDLQPFPQLLKLDLSYNNIVTLDGDLFSLNPKLRWISITGNQIEHIGHGLVTFLNDLTAIFLDSNVCINQSARNRNEVLQLGGQLSDLCPPLEGSTATPTTSTKITTTASTTTEVTTCSCEAEINHLLDMNEAFEERLLEAEKKIRELGSLPFNEQSSSSGNHVIGSHC